MDSSTIKVAEDKLQYKQLPSSKSADESKLYARESLHPKIKGAPNTFS